MSQTGPPPSMPPPGWFADPLHRHEFAQIWYIIEGEFIFGKKLYARAR